MAADPNDREEGAPAGAAGPRAGEDPDGRVIAEDWENRLLCSDPDCFGLIGPDGNCRECGKLAVRKP